MAGDVYSCAIIMVEVLTQDPPYLQELLSMSVDEILDLIKAGKEPLMRPQFKEDSIVIELRELTSLMTSCWDEDPAKRPTFKITLKNYEHMTKNYHGSGSLVDHLMLMMEQYTNNLEQLVEERTKQLIIEKRNSEELLYQILPRPVAAKLMKGETIPPENFNCVTIYFSDLVQFTNLSSKSTPMQVVAFLNDLYSCFDTLTEDFDVYKVETIGDAYMVVSGVPVRNEHRHAGQIALMSLKLLQRIKTFKIKHVPDHPVLLRIGLHSGGVCAGVVGLKMPRYCLFGGTVNVASKMESSGEPLKIQISETTHKLLQTTGNFEMEKRWQMEVEGVGIMTTYWLLGESQRPQTLPTEDKKGPKK